MPNIDTSKKFDSVQLYRIRKLLQELSSKSGRGTELVTLYLPPKKPIHEAISALREESGTASNIKSDTTRAHVQDALTKTMQRLRLYKNTPENGLIIFCGAIPGPGGPGNEIIELHEVLPSKPVPNYLYRCISPDSKILLKNGMSKTIDELQSSWENEIVKSTGNHGKTTIGARITKYFHNSPDGRRVFNLTVESGRSIIATEDHLFFTPAGWRDLRTLRQGDFVCVYPSDDLEYSCIGGSQVLFQDTSLVTEESIRELSYRPANLDLSLRRLRERGLLPMNGSHSKLPIIARIIGHLFSDGSLTHNIETRNGKSYSHFTADFCLGDMDSVREVSNDLSALGAKVAKPYHSTRIINVDGRSYKTSTIHIKFRDTATIALLRCLGAPVGSKVKNGTKIPPWLMGSRRQVQKEFLASYLGGDGEAPRIIKSNPVSAVRLVFHRIEELHANGMQYAQNISRLFNMFGVRINAIRTQPGYFRKDGSKTEEFEIRFALTEQNVIRLCHIIGFRYSKRKSSNALLVGEYIRIKARLRSLVHQKMATARDMLSKGSSILQISASLGITQSLANSWTNGSVSTPILRSKVIPQYQEWLSLARVKQDEILLWETVASIEPVELNDVRDLTVESEDHSFFANGFLVHNCDDHFHLDPLREMLKEENVIGVLALDATEAGLGIVSGDSWEVIDVTSSGVSGKTRKGGQSARRYERLREMELTDYYNRLADHAKKAFLEQYTVKGLIVSGPGPTKDQFVKENYLDYRLQKAIIGVLDTGYSGREGVRETIEKSGELLQNVRVVEESKLVQRFLREINSDSGLAIYGIEDVIKALKRAAVDVVMISDDSDMLYLRATCSKCGEIRERFIKRSQYVSEKQTLLSTPCPKCGSTEIQISEKDIVDYFADIALDSGARVEVISSKTEDGAMLKSFGTVSAILRYRV